MQKQVDAQHQHEKRQETDEHAHNHHNRHDKGEEIVGFARVGFIAGDIVLVFVHILLDGRVAGSIHLNNEAQGLQFATLPVFFVCPFHKFFGHDDGVESIAKSHDAALHIVAQAIARQIKHQRNARRLAFADLRHALSGSEAKIVERKIVAAHNHRHRRAIGIKLPSGVYIDKFRRNAFEEKLGAHSVGIVNPDARRNGKLAIHKWRHLAAPGLRLDVGNEFGRKLGGATHQRTGAGEIARDNQVVFADKRLLIVEHRQHIAIELHRQNHDGESHEIRQRKADELRLANVLAQEFPHQ